MSEHLNELSDIHDALRELVFTHPLPTEKQLRIWQIVSDYVGGNAHVMVLMRGQPPVIPLCEVTTSDDFSEAPRSRFTCPECSKRLGNVVEVTLMASVERRYVLPII
jgi:hypothetical protein